MSKYHYNITEKFGLIQVMGGLRESPEAPRKLVTRNISINKESTPVPMDG